ncbi:hypothetical protein BJ322DRAFT_452086 [Thelephora terrestris]|uniref:F-box domain-containing protein n=1 Tax=Thelephora terrestris TaxID=56493 RepID=A0A9P6H581_9AGAM|nr:hypothetical protein BJ322DRAFT_452086 [Thelephora terrestris]
MQGLPSDQNASLSMMGREINEGQIRELERKIEEGLGDIIQLKRARNSLLNISMRVPPELLGHIFLWRITPDTHLPHPVAAPKGSHAFLLVCHHWFEIGSHTPELWSYWGNDTAAWPLWYKRSRSTPVDLVLNGPVRGYYKDFFDKPTQDALQGLAKRDAVRSVQLLDRDDAIITSVLSALTLGGEGVESSSIESISLEDVDVSKFFARYRFPKLWHLKLSRKVQISSWEHLGLHTGALTTLSLTIENDIPVPTMPQLLSFLAANPRLENLTLHASTIPQDDGCRSTAPVPLRHLKKLLLGGIFHPVFRLLH